MILRRASEAKEITHSHNKFLVFLTVKYWAKECIYFSGYDNRWNKLQERKSNNIKLFSDHLFVL